MEIWLLFATVPILVLLVGVWQWHHAGRELSEEELRDFHLAQIELAARKKYQFDPRELPSDLTFKRSMEAPGRFHEVSVHLDRALNTMASHLKWKKHEWSVLMLAKDGRVFRVWCNKGPDSTTTWLKLSAEQIRRIVIETGATLVVLMHNHPNPNPSQYSVFAPSPQDKAAFVHYRDLFSQLGSVDFLDVLCERGDWLVYGSYLAGQRVIGPSTRLTSEMLAATSRSARREAREAMKVVAKGWSSRASKLDAPRWAMLERVREQESRQRA